jgi:hypothetical protein
MPISGSFSGQVDSAAALDAHLAWPFFGPEFASWSSREESETNKVSSKQFLIVTSWLSEWNQSAMKTTNAASLSHVKPRHFLHLSMLGECVGFSEFGEFEYSPKCPFSPFCPDSTHSPDIRQPFCPDSTHSTDIRQPFCPDSIHSPDIRQPFCPDSTHSTLDTFAGIRQNKTRIRHIRTSNSPFWRIWREWPLLMFYPNGIFCFFLNLWTGGTLNLLI